MNKKEKEEETERFVDRLDEWAYDDAMASEYVQQQMEDMKAEAIDEFQKERLQEYYLYNKNLTQMVDNHLNKAKKLIDARFSDAGFVFSSTAIEIILKNMFLKPILHGSFMSQYVADLVVEEILHTRYSSIRKILFYVLKHSAGFNFETYKRPRIKIKLWNEIVNIRLQRNKIIHIGNSVTLSRAKYSYRVATHLSKIIFPKIINNVGLKILKEEIVYK